MGSSHVLALSSRGAVFSWGNGDVGQLGHSDFEDQKKPKQIMTIYADVADMLAAGDTSIVKDELNNLYSFGCNLQGQLGDNSAIKCRNVPTKFGKQFLLEKIMKLRGNCTRDGKTTLSLMTDK